MCNFLKKKTYIRRFAKFDKIREDDNPQKS